METYHIMFDVPDSELDQVRSIVAYSDELARLTVEALRQTKPREAGEVDTERLANFLAGSYLREGKRRTPEDISADFVIRYFSTHIGR